MEQTHQIRGFEAAKGDPASFSQGDSECGLLRLAGRECPVVDATLLLHADDRREAVADAIRAGDHDLARATLLGKYAGRGPTLRRFNRHRLLADLINFAPTAPLLKAIPGKYGEIVKHAAQFELYMRHRFSVGSYLAFLPLLAVLKEIAGEDDSLIVDAPCGLGHLGFAMSSVVDQRRLLGIEINPAFAWASRAFCTPHMHLAMAADLNQPLPMADGSCRAIFSADGFWHVDDMPAVAAEFARCLDDRGVFFIPHLHVGKLNTLGGDGLSAAQYANLMPPGWHVRLYPESHLFDAFKDDQPLDLSAAFDPADLELTPALTLVASRDEAVFRSYPSVRGQIDPPDGRLIINPLYKQQPDGQTVKLTRHIPPTLAAEFPEIAKIVPPTANVPANLGSLTDADRARLLKAHVLLTVPKKY